MATKNEIKNETKNVVANPEMEKFVTDNLSLVPNVMKSRFDKLTLEEKVQKIKDYQQRQEWKKEWEEKNKMVNRVKELFEKRHATVQDAKEVMDFCKDFINSFKQREIEKLDEQIQKLQEMKKQFDI